MLRDSMLRDSILLGNILLCLRRLLLHSRRFRIVVVTLRRWSHTAYIMFVMVRYDFKSLVICYACVDLAVYGIIRSGLQRLCLEGVFFGARVISNKFKYFT
jgi:hypothetical protein